MRDAVKEKVLAELGILRRGGRLEGAAAGVGSGHLVSAHTPLWAFENPAFASPFAGGAPLFDHAPLPPDPDQALARCRLPVFLGAARSRVFEAALARRPAALLVFEPEEERLESFLDGFSAKALAEAGVFCALGDPAGMRPSLERLLPEDLFRKLGCPGFFVLEGLEAARPDWVVEVRERLELLCWRHRIYPVSGQFNNRGLPLRPITRGLFYDQQRHAYENAPRLGLGNLREARDLFRGFPAVLIAAGPDLAERAEFLRANRDRAVLIAVNNALGPLQDMGVVPHFAVINDNALDCARSFQGLAPLPGTVLAAHCFSHAPEGLFGKTLFFGAWRAEVFGAMPNLHIYGSVITAALALARHLGCRSVVLAGVQLAGTDPWRLSYAPGSMHAHAGGGARPLTGAWPQLCPARAASGQTLYSTLNFRDTALWFLDELRATNTRCVNLSRQSLIYGPGVEIDENPDLPERPGLEKILAGLLRRPPLRRDPARVRAFLAREREIWANTAGPLDYLLGQAGPGFLAAGLGVLDQLDRGNVSYLVQRYAGFDNARFHGLVFGSTDPAAREEGLRYLLSHVRDMAREFLGLLDRAMERVAG